MHNPLSRCRMRRRIARMTRISPPLTTTTIQKIIRWTIPRTTTTPRIRRCKITYWSHHPVHPDPLLLLQSNVYVDDVSRTNHTGPIIAVSVNDVSLRWIITVHGSIIVWGLGITNIFYYLYSTPVYPVCIAYYSSLPDSHHVVMVLIIITIILRETIIIK
jgi:hypothetical protein